VPQRPVASSQQREAIPFARTLDSPRTSLSHSLAPDPPPPPAVTPDQVHQVLSTTPPTEPLPAGAGAAGGGGADVTADASKGRPGLPWACPPCKSGGRGRHATDARQTQ
jgi:hypothetical protein